MGEMPIAVSLGTSDLSAGKLEVSLGVLLGQTNYAPTRLAKGSTIKIEL